MQFRIFADFAGERGELVFTFLFSKFEFRIVSCLGPVIITNGLDTSGLLCWKERKELEFTLPAHVVKVVVSDLIADEMCDASGVKRVQSRFR